MERLCLHLFVARCVDSRNQFISSKWVRYVLTEEHTEYVHLAVNEKSDNRFLVEFMDLQYVESFYVLKGKSRRTRFPENRNFCVLQLQLIKQKPALIVL